MRLERHELALREAERVAQVGRDIEGDGDGVGGFGTDLADAQRMELRSAMARVDAQYGLK